MTWGRWLWMRAVDGLQYAVVVNALLLVVLAPAAVLVTGSLVALKWLLFLVGLLFIGVGSVKLRPPPAGRESPRFGVGNSASEDGLGGLVTRLPPVAWYDPDPGERLSDGARILLAGATAWVVSFALESVFGVGVPTVG